mgnify:FL=1
MQDSIQIIASHKIDHTKWNLCIEQSAAPLIYAKTFYLDHLTDQWHGMVIGDYHYVMPIPWRKKYFIRYAYQVPFIQQLGIFGKDKMHDESQCLAGLQRFCKYGDYPFNYSNNHIFKNGVLKNNYILELSTYPEVAKNYSPDLRQNLKKASNHALAYKQVSYEKAIAMYYELYHHKTPHVHEDLFLRFKSLCKLLNENELIYCREAINSKNETMAILLLLSDGSRLYNMMNSTTNNGRKISANHFLLDKVMQEFCSKNLVFDFEGSDIPGIKSFYENFGAKLQPYTSVHFNRLPFPLNYLKK